MRRTIALLTAGASFLTLTLAPTLTLAGCASAPPQAQPPGLQATGAEAPVTVTVPAGAEALPVWDRQSGRAALAIPADLLFGVDSAELSPAAERVLGTVLEETGQHPSARITVEGFADSDGEAAHNQQLSEQRAAAVARWLTSRAIASSAITARGWGETRPAVAETDEASKARNRRVVVTVSYEGENR